MKRTVTGILALLSLASASHAATLIFDFGPDQEVRPRQERRLAPSWLLQQQKADGHWASPKGKHEWGVTSLGTLALLADGHGFDEKGKAWSEAGKAILRARTWLSRQVLISSKGKKGIADGLWDQVLTCYALVECDGKAKKESEATRVLLEHLLGSPTLRRHLFESGTESTPAAPSAKQRAILRSWFFIMLEARKDLGFKTAPAFPKATKRWWALSQGDRSAHEAMSRLIYQIHVQGRLTEPMKRDAQILIDSASALFSAEILDYESCYLSTLALYQVGKVPWDRWKKPLEQGLARCVIHQGKLKGTFPVQGAVAESYGRVYTTALGHWAYGFYTAWSLSLLR